MARGDFVSASGRPAEACACLCVAEHLDTTCEDLQDRDSYRAKNLRAQKRRASRVLKGRQILW
eukprot:9261209-Pyramimonas_sp.AAC.1